ncbi:MAG: transcriptional repressor [Lachnospiraceae bacterium]|nr:transcriptional repressor [Lachnospiraceae bacterium]
MTTMKYSRQREAIKRCLAERMDHPTAEMIYSDLREHDPRLSLGTVYRNLALLTELGEIKKISTGYGPDHFDGDTTRHFHFVCRKCHRIIDLHMPDPQSLLSQTDEEVEGLVEEVILNANGLCGNCDDTVTDT